MSPTVRRLSVWFVLASAASIASLIAGAVVITIGVFLEMCTRPHTLRWGVLVFCWIVGPALISIEWYDLSVGQSRWVDVLAGSIRLSGFLVIIAGVVGYIALEQRFPPPRREPSHPSRVDMFFARVDAAVWAFLSGNENFWSRVQARPIGNALVLVASLAICGVMLAISLGMKF